MKSNVQLLGISNDPVESHKKFCDALKLPFPLLADEGGKVSERYGILIVTPKGDRLSGRSVFLVDREGKVSYLDSKYDLSPAADHDALLKAVKALGERSSGASPEKPKSAAAPALKLEGLSFGQLTVNGRAYDRDVVIAADQVRERRKGPSRVERDRYGHTPLTLREEIPWDCEVLVIGTGMDGQLPVADEVKEEAKRRGVKLILLRTPQAVEHLRENHRPGVNAILHITC